MYDLDPPHVFVHERVFRNLRAVARMERMLTALGGPPVETVTTADTDRVIELTRPPAEAGMFHGQVRHGLVRGGSDPSLLFNTFVWDPSERAELDRGRYTDVFSRDLARVLAGVGEDFAFSRRGAHFDDPAT